MVFTLNASCGSLIGNGRNNNEDNFYFNKKRLPIPNKGLKNPLKCRDLTDDPVVFAIFDGMGGECQGEEASNLASKIFSEEFKKLDELALSGKVFMYETCEKVGLRDITEINITELHNIKVVYQGRITLELGKTDGERLSKKLAFKMIMYYDTIIQRRTFLLLYFMFVLHNKNYVVFFVSDH